MMAQTRDAIEQAYLEDAIADAIRELDLVRGELRRSKDALRALTEENRQLKRIIARHEEERRRGP